MATRLSLDDFNAPDWGPLVLSGDWPGFRAFWSAVLQLATADQADAVVYQPDLGDDCLAVKIEGQDHVMDPPPAEYRRELLAAARKMALGDPEGNIVGRLPGLWNTAAPLRACSSRYFAGRHHLGGNRTGGWYRSPLYLVRQEESDEST